MFLYTLSVVFSGVKRPNLLHLFYVTLSYCYYNNTFYNDYIYIIFSCQCFSAIMLLFLAS